MAAKQALTAIDQVTRGWGRELGLDESGVMVLMLMGERGELPEWELAKLCGRKRQQVHRSLKRMERRELLRPAERSRKGRATRWTFTDRGIELWRCLERAVAAWEATLAWRYDVGELRKTLESIAELAVNRPGADGWGLLVPNELRLDPIRTRAEEAGLLEPRPPAEVNSNGLTREEFESAERAWMALWR